MTKLSQTTVDRLRDGGGLLGSALLVAATFVVAGVLGNSDIVRAETTLLVNVVLVVGLYTFVGPSGILSFGHAAFMAVGAYAAALLTLPAGLKQVSLPDLPAWLGGAQIDLLPAVLVAAVLAAVVAVVVGGPLMRLNGIQAGIATLSLLVISNVVIAHWSGVTKGPGSLAGIPTTVGNGTAFAWALVAIVVAFLFTRSRTGVRLRASRTDVPAARAAGVPVIRLRIVALAVSAAIVAVGGALHAHVVGVLSPDAVYLQITFFTIAMLVIGGTGSLSGAVVGAVTISVAMEVLRQLESAIDRPGLREVGVALILLVILIARPSGITGGREFLSRIGGPGLGRRPSSGSAIWRDAPPESRPAEPSETLEGA